MCAGLSALREDSLPLQAFSVLTTTPIALPRTASSAAARWAGEWLPQGRFGRSFHRGTSPLVPAVPWPVPQCVGPVSLSLNHAVRVRRGCVIREAGRLLQVIASRADEAAMHHALALAQRAQRAGDVPVGAVVMDAHGCVLGRGWNRRELGDPTAHAEVVALRQAGREVGSWRLAGASLVVTLEPCPMCAGAALLARVDRVVFGAFDPKAGAAGSVWDLLRDPRANHHPEVVAGVLEQRCQAVLQDFFRDPARRARRAP